MDEYDMSTAFEPISGGNYPPSPIAGQCVFNEDTGKPEWYNGQQWIQGDGFGRPAPVQSYNANDIRLKIINETGFNWSSSSLTYWNAKSKYGKVLLCDYYNKMSGQTHYGAWALADVDDNGNLTFQCAGAAKGLSYNNRNAYFAHRSYLMGCDFTPDGKSVLIGAYGDQPNGFSNGGTVSIFDFDDDGNEIHHQVFTGQDSASNTYYGRKAAISRDGLWAVIGRYNNSTTNPPGTSNISSVEFYTRASRTDDFTFYGDAAPTIAPNADANTYLMALDGDNLLFLEDGTLVCASSTSSTNNSSGKNKIHMVKPTTGGAFA